MCVAFNTDIRQMQYFSVTAFCIHSLDEFLSHRRSRTPVILVGIFDFGLRNIVTVYDENREPCQLFELTKGNTDSFSRTEETVIGNRCRHFAFGKMNPEPGSNAMMPFKLFPASVPMSHPGPQP